jgi:hypothetical protein
MQKREFENKERGLAFFLFELFLLSVFSSLSLSSSPSSFSSSRVRLSRPGLVSRRPKLWALGLPFRRFTRALRTAAPVHARDQRLA